MKLQLVDGWRNAWKWASIRLAAIFAILAGLLAANPHMALGLIAFLPNGHWRTIIAIAVSLVVFVIPTIARLFEKKPVNGKQA